MTSSVVYICCEDEVKELFDRMYELKRNGDFSEEAMQIVRKCIEENPSGYTAWKMYFEMLQKLGYSMENEDDVTAVIESSPKNYQVWNFRRACYLAGISSSGDELRNTDVAINDDHKNYHAWANRQAILCHEALLGNLELWREEMEYADALIQLDVFNNSAWSQKVVGIKWLGLGVEELKEQLSKTIEILTDAPHSIAAWSFLQYLVLSSPQFNADGLKKVVKLCYQILEKDSNCLPCLECLGEIYFAISMNCCSEKMSFRDACLQSAKEIWKNCIKIDPIRTSYYQSRIDHIIVSDLDESQETKDMSC